MGPESSMNDVVLVQQLIKEVEVLKDLGEFSIVTVLGLLEFYEINKVENVMLFLAKSVGQTLSADILNRCTQNSWWSQFYFHLINLLNIIQIKNP